MQAATILYRNGRLEAREEDDQWSVRLAHAEARARYLDLALAELLGDAPDAHRTAARLLAKMADVAEQRAPNQHAEPMLRRQPRRRHRHEIRPKPRQLTLRIIGFTLVASTAFILTTWFSTLR